MSDNIKLDEIVQAYLTIRGQRENIAREFELQDAELKAEQAQLEQVLLEQCNEMNAETIRTGAGTIVKTLKENYICSDWDGLKSFIMENGLIELMQQRLHNTNLKEYLANHDGEGMPPGVSSFREYSIVVKKPSKS
jgi:hypothetical protein